MTASGEFYIRIDHPPEVNCLLEALCQSGHALLRLDGSRDAASPVLMTVARAGEILCLDISAMRDRPQSESVRAGQLFRVFGQHEGSILRTPPLRAAHAWETAQGSYCQCAFPAYLEKQQRRDAFRAKLHHWMCAKVELRDVDTTASGILRDLSLNGCMVEFDASASALLDGQPRVLQLEMIFPDGTRFEAEAFLRHQTLHQHHILCGFSLAVSTREQEHRIWHLVREIEREAARNAASGKRDLKRSPLFSGDALGSLPGHDMDNDDSNSRE